MSKIIIEDIDTKITEKWGVKWDEMETARDFLQNFYDANSIDDIGIDINESTVTIIAPAVFDYNELIYLGSNKTNDSDSIGQYGEGFKASVLNALRNFNCGVEIEIGDKKLQFYFKNKEIAEINTRVIFCEVSKKEIISGTKLIISNCTTKLIEEFKFGLNHFYYKGNPLFGDILLENSDCSIQICKSNNKKNGYVFYKKLLRAKVDLPITIICDMDAIRVDEKITHDRDRKAFNEEVLELLYKFIFKKFSISELSSTILFLENWFEKGHKIISVMATAKNYRDNESILFPDNYFANEKLSDLDKHHYPNLFIEAQNVLADFKKQGYKSCPAYMSKFNMKNPVGIARELIAKKQELLNSTYSRDLSTLEKEGVRILSLFIKDISLDMFKNFEGAKYTTSDNDDIIGELKKKRGYKQQHVFLNTNFFTFPFNEAIAILFHEWAHIYGYDGSRNFSDALTHFIALLLKNEEAIKNLISFEKSWEKNVQKVTNERGVTLVKSKQINKIVDNLTKEQLNYIVKEIPDGELFKLLEKLKIQ